MRNLSSLIALACTSMLSACASPEAIADKQSLSGDEVHNLCYGHLYGVGLPQDNRLAFRWCKQAAALGGASSETLLAETYLLGLGTKQDNEMAANWYEKAAAQGHPHAEFMLYQLYVIRGYGTMADRARGMEALKKAAESGYPRAMQALGDSKIRK